MCILMRKGERPNESNNVVLELERLRLCYIRVRSGPMNCLHQVCLFHPTEIVPFARCAGYSASLSVRFCAPQQVGRQ